MTAMTSIECPTVSLFFSMNRWFHFVFNLTQVDTEKDKLPAQVSISVLVLAISIISSFVLTCVIGIILGLLCRINFRMKSGKANNSKKNPNKGDQSTTTMKGPEYEEVELDDKTSTIDLSHNIAYEYVRKT